MPIFDHMLKMDKKAVIKVVIQGATDKWGGVIESTPFSDGGMDCRPILYHLLVAPLVVINDSLLICFSGTLVPLSIFKRFGHESVHTQTHYNWR